MGRVARVEVLVANSAGTGSLQRCPSGGWRDSRPVTLPGCRRRTRSRLRRGSRPRNFGPRVPLVVGDGGGKRGTSSVPRQGLTVSGPGEGPHAGPQVVDEEPSEVGQSLVTGESTRGGGVHGTRRCGTPTDRYGPGSWSETRVQGKESQNSSGRNSWSH